MYKAIKADLVNKSVMTCHNTSVLTEDVAI